MTEKTILDLYRHETDDPRDEHYIHFTPDERRPLSTVEFFGRTAGLASGLEKLGVGSGDRVMLLTDNYRILGKMRRGPDGTIWAFKHPATEDFITIYDAQCFRLSDGKRVYMLGARGQLLALNVQTGRPVWSTDLVEDHGIQHPGYGFAASPVVAGELVIVPSGAEQPVTGAVQEHRGTTPGTTGLGFDLAAYVR